MPKAKSLWEGRETRAVTVTLHRGEVHMATMCSWLQKDLKLSYFLVRFSFDIKTCTVNTSARRILKIDLKLGIFLN